MITFLDNVVLLPGPLTVNFDYVLANQLSYGSDAIADLVFERPPSGYTRETTWGKCVRRCRMLCAPERWITRHVIYLLLSFVPFVGPVLIILLKAPRKGFKCHRRYFILKKYNNAQIFYFWNRNFWDYFWFGVISLSLEQIPYLCYFFAFTNNTGAALWAVDIEKRKLMEVYVQNDLFLQTALENGAAEAYPDKPSPIDVSSEPMTSKGPPTSFAIHSHLE